VGRRQGIQAEHAAFGLGVGRASANSVAGYAYSDNYLIDLKHAVIMDVEGDDGHSSGRSRRGPPATGVVDHRQVMIGRLQSAAG
jgi:hypothetical protein